MSDSTQPAPDDHVLKPAASEPSAPPGIAAPLRINVDDLHIALVWRDPISAYYLNLQTGQITLHLPGDDPALDEAMATRPTEFLRIQAIDPRHSYQVMADFVEFVSDEELREQLRRVILGKGAFRRFKEFIAQHPAERDLWLIFKEQREMTHVRAWLAELKFPHETYDPYEDRRRARMATLEQARERKIRVRRLHQVCVPVRNLAAARAFYAEVLQLTPAPAEPGADPGAATCIMRCGGVELRLQETPDAPAAPCPGGKLVLEVVSLAQARKALEAAGFPPGATEKTDGGSRFRVQDPGGTVVEFLEPVAPAPSTPRFDPASG